MTKVRFIVIGIIIACLGLAIRFYDVEAIPAGLYWDEVAILLDAKSIADTGLDIHQRPWFQVLYPSYGDYKLPIYIWVTAGLVKLFGVHDWVVRLPNILASLGSIVLAGLIAKDIFQTKTSSQAKVLQLTTMAVVATLPWSIHFARTGFEGHFAQFLLTLSIWLGLKSNKNIIWAVLAAIVGVLSVYTYYSVRFVWPVVFGFSQTINLKSFSRSNFSPKWFVQIGLPLVIFFIFLLPMTTSPLYQASNQLRLSTASVLNAYDYPVQANQYRQLAGNTVIDRVLFHRQWLMMRELLINATDFVDVKFLFLTGDANLRHGTGRFGLLLVSTAPFFFWGIYKSWQENKSVFIFLLSWWLIALVPAAVPEETPHALRSINALTPISLFLGFGFYSLLKKSSPWQTIVVFCLVILNLGAFLAHYFLIYPQQSAEFWQAGYKQEAQNLFDQSNRQPDELFKPTNSDDRFYLWLLLYGEFSSEEIQALAKENFRPTQLRNIQLQ